MIIDLTFTEIVLYIVHCVGRSFQLFLRAIVILMENLVLNMHVQML